MRASARIYIYIYIYIYHFEMVRLRKDEPKKALNGFQEGNSWNLRIPRGLELKCFKTFYGFREAVEMFAVVRCGAPPASEPSPPARAPPARAPCSAPRRHKTAPPLLPHRPCQPRLPRRACAPCVRKRTRACALPRHARALARTPASSACDDSWFAWLLVNGLHEKIRTREAIENCS